MADGEPLTATDAAAAIARGEISAEEYASSCLARIDALEGEIRAFAHIDPDYVLAQARALDERRRSGLPIGPLHGVPVGIKDIFDTKDYPTECGSPLFSGRSPLHDATTVAKLRSAGAVIFGKTQTTEFAYFHPAPTRNPRDTSRTPGGSSSGSAAAVAAGMTPIALGSQTNGSVIRPGSFCGVYAMKPSHGLVSRTGVLSLSTKLDHVGVFARSLADLALVLEAIAGYDPADPGTNSMAAPVFRRVLSEPAPLPPRFALVRTPIWDRVTDDVREGCEAIAERLADHMTEVELPEPFTGAWDDHQAIMSADMAHRLGETVLRGGESASQRLRAFLAAGREVSAVRYLAAIDAARRYAAGLATIFDHYDAIITPATAGVAPQGLESTGDPAFCTLWTLTGLPALSLPLLTGERGLPIGVQLVGPKGDDARLLRTARVLVETLTNRRPSGRRRKIKT